MTTLFLVAVCSFLLGAVLMSIAVRSVTVRLWADTGLTDLLAEARERVLSRPGRQADKPRYSEIKAELNRLRNHGWS